MRFYLPFVTLLVGAAAQSIIENDLNQRISPQITKLANDVEGFPDSGLDGALVGLPQLFLLTILTKLLDDRFRLEGLGDCLQHCHGECYE